MLEASGKKTKRVRRAADGGCRRANVAVLMNGPDVASADDLVNLRLDHAETLEDGLLWLRYGVEAKNA